MSVPKPRAGMAPEPLFRAILRKAKVVALYHCFAPPVPVFGRYQCGCLSDSAASSSDESTYGGLGSGPTNRAL
jgi:hypothetical protein